MDLIFGNPIKKRVLKIINQKIAEAEKEYKVGCDEIEKEAEKSKTDLADKLVNQLVGKFIK